MTAEQIYQLALDLGLKNDPRDPREIKYRLAKEKKKYQTLSLLEKKLFDVEKLTNPYSDTRIHHLSGKNKTVKTVLVGIDIDEAEIILASQLNQQGKKIDLLIGHHPAGRAYADLHEVMDMLADIYHRQGVPIHIAENLTSRRICEVGRALHPINHSQPVDIARLLNLSLMNIHTPADNLVLNFLTNYLAKKKPYTIDGIIKALLAVPEYEEATKIHAGPVIVNGHRDNKAGKILVDMTGGTSPDQEVYAELSKIGISTIVGMHMNEKSVELAKKHHLNIIIAGHIASDSLGINLLLDQIEKKGIKIIPVGGLIRIKR